MLKLFIPHRRGIFRIAAGGLSSYFLRITGETLPVTCRDDGGSDLIILGSDADNAFVHELIVQKPELLNLLPKQLFPPLFFFFSH